ncbi:MAG: response regulator transcription factor [Bryobacterales bacterium]|nr:response regulator transcription factor [Bryobacterales bacterium]
MTRKRVLLADDHPVVTEGLRRMLESDFEIAGIVENGRELIKQAEALRPDLIIADISMPLLNGLEAARQIKKLLPKTKIIFLTMHDEVAYAADAFQSGADGYVIKSSAGKELLSAVGEVLAGKTYVPPVLHEIELHPPSAKTGHAPKTAPTGRQQEVLQLFAEGHTIKEIAHILNISPRTVEFHKYRLMEELNIRTSAELVQYALKHRIVT